MEWIDAALSLLVVLGLTASALGYRHSLMRWDNSPEWFFAAAKTLYSIGFGFLLLLWGTFWGLLRLFDHDAALRMVFHPAAAYVNAVGMGIILLGVYASLKARQLILIEEDQRDWPWLWAWAHPAFLGFELGKRRR